MGTILRDPSIGEILVQADDLQHRVRQLGEEISRDYAGKDLLLIGVLKGAVFFLADLMREIECPCEVDFMAVASYGSATESSGVVRILKDLDTPIEGRDVLIVEDIVDSGLTLQYLLRTLAILRDEAAVLDAVLDDALARAGDPPALAALRALPPALRRLAVQRLAALAGGPAVGHRTGEILALGEGGQLDVGGGLRAEIRGETLRFGPSRGPAAPHRDRASS